MINIYNHLTLSKADDKLKALKAKTEVPQRRNSAPSLQHRNLA